MNTKINEWYEAPQVEVIEVEIEQGFADSIGGQSTDEDMPGGGGGSYPWS